VVEEFAKGLPYVMNVEGEARILLLACCSYEVSQGRTNIWWFAETTGYQELVS